MFKKFDTLKSNSNCDIYLKVLSDVILTTGKPSLVCVHLFKDELESNLLSASKIFCAYDIDFLCKNYSINSPK